MFYGNDEEKKNHIRKEAQALRLAASKIYLVKEVVRHFDGKVYNCRFDNAISDLSIDGFRFWCHKDSYGRKARYEVADADAMLVYSVMETYIKKLDSARMEIIKYEGMVEAFKMMEENG